MTLDEALATGKRLKRKSEPILAITEPFGIGYYEYGFIEALDLLFLCRLFDRDKAANDWEVEFENKELSGDQLRKLQKNRFQLRQFRIVPSSWTNRKR